MGKGYTQRVVDLLWSLTVQLGNWQYQILEITAALGG
jgi:hypothetical protein